MSVIFILFFTAIVFLVGRILPGHMRTLIGPHQIAMALALPILGMITGHFIVFAISVLLLIFYAPTITHTGFTTLRLDASEVRARLVMLCVPLMPLLTYTMALGGFTLVQLTYPHLLCLGLLATMLISGQRFYEPRLANWDMLFLLMLLSQIIMDSRGHDLTEAMRATLHVLLNLALPYFVFSRVVSRAKAPADLILSLILGGCILALITAYESISVWLLYDNYWTALHADPDIISGYTKMRGGLLRARASFPESTGLSLFFGVLIIMLVALRKHVQSNLTFLVMSGLLLTGAFFTFARIGYLTIVVGLLFYMLQERRWIGLIGLIIATPICGALLLTIAEHSPALQASLGMEAEAYGTTDYRSLLLTFGLEFFRENWLLGSSLEDMLQQMEHFRQGEGIIDLVNQPLTILMRGGAFGFCAYYMFFASLLVTSYIYGPRLDKYTKATVTACFSALIAITAGLLTTSYGRNEMTFILLLTICAGALARPQQQAQKHSATTRIGATQSFKFKHPRSM